MSIENILNAVKPIVENRCFSEISPVFFILDDGDSKDDLINALALSIALFGGNSVVARGSRQNIARAFEFYEAEGLFEITDNGDLRDLVFTPRGKIEEKIIIASLNKTPRTGKISTFSIKNN